MSESTLPKLLTVQELADHLRVHRDTVYSMVSTGQIPVIQAGRRRYLFNLPAVLSALTKEAPTNE